MATTGGSKGRLAKSQIEIERIRLKREERYHKFTLWTSSIQGVRVALWIVSAWVPLQVVRDMVGDVSGKQTNFTASVTFSFTLSILLSIGWGYSVAKSHLRKKKLLRARVRLQTLEARLLERTGVSTGDETQ